MKKLLTSLLCLVMVLCMMPAMTWAADSRTDDGTFKDTNGIRYQITGDSTVKVISDTDDEAPFYPTPIIGEGQATYTGEITIPEKVTNNGKEYSITEIGKRAFGDTDITKITLPKTVKTIGPWAFDSCIQLVTVSLEDSALEEIGDYAFANCGTLANFQIPTTVTKIGEGAFGSCKALESLCIPAGVTDNLFQALTANGPYPHLDKVTIAEGSPYDIEGGVLYKGTVACLYMGPDEHVTVREGTTEIFSSGYYTGKVCAFTNGRIKSVTLPDTITKIPDGAFSQAVNMESITLPSGLTEIGSSAFYKTGLTSITLPDTVKTIGISAFQDAYALESIVIPEGVTEIPDAAFSGDSALKTIVIAASVTKVGSDAFSGLEDGAEDVTLIMKGTTPPVFEEDAFGSETPAGLTVIVPAGSEEAYKDSSCLLHSYIEGTDGGEVKPGISYKLSLPAEASVEKGKTVEITLDAAIPEGAELKLEQGGENVVTAALSDDNRKLAITGVEIGEAEVELTLTLEGIELASASCSVTVKEAQSDIPSVPTIQHPTIDTDDNANVTLSSYGTVATITVADGYELVDVTINGISQGKVTFLYGLKTGDKVVVTTKKIVTAEDLKAEVKALKLVARSVNEKAPSGKNAIKVYWFEKDGKDLSLDGYEIYRSTKKNSGYGTKPIYKTTKSLRYFNTSAKKGTRYYYKVRGYKIVEGEKVFTEYSLKAIRTAK